MSVRQPPRGGVIRLALCGAKFLTGNRSHWRDQNRGRPMVVHVINGRASKQAMSLHRGHHGRHEGSTQNKERNIPYHHTNPTICPPNPIPFDRTSHGLSVMAITEIGLLGRLLARGRHRLPRASIGGGAAPLCVIAKSGARLPLWVKSGLDAVNSLCLLYPRKRTLLE
jgi:hypothetical protein